MDILARIMALSAERNITQKDLANALGVSQPYLNQVLHGKKKLPLESLTQICKFLDISLSEFFSPFSEMKQVPSYLSRFYERCEKLKEADIEVLASMANRLRFLQEKIKLSARKTDLSEIITAKPPASSPVSSLALVGEAAAGLPLFSSLDDETIFVPERFADPDRFLAVRARGDSMEPKINNHDIVIAQRGLVPHPGQAALVCLAGMSDAEYTIKCIYPEHDQLVLRSYNNTYQDMVYSPDDLRSCDAIVHVIPSSAV